MKKELLFLWCFLWPQCIACGMEQVARLKQMALEVVAERVMMRVNQQKDITTRLQQCQEYVKDLPQDLQQDIARYLSIVLIKEMSLCIPLTSRQEPIISMEFNQDQTRFFAGYASHVLCHYDVHQGDLMELFNLPRSEMRNADFYEGRYRDNKLLIAAVQNNHVILHNPPDLHDVNFSSLERLIKLLGINHDSTLLAIVESNNCVSIWDIANKEFLFNWHHNNVINKLLFAMNNLLLCSDDEGALLLDPHFSYFWNVIYYKVPDTLLTPCFHPQQPKLFFADVANVLNVLDIAYPHNVLLQEFGSCHESIYALAIPPSGSLLIAGCEDGMIRIWDLVERYQCASLPGHIDSITQLACTKDFFASGDIGGALCLWPLLEELTFNQIMFLYLFKSFKNKKLNVRSLNRNHFLLAEVLGTFKVVIQNYIKNKLLDNPVSYTK